MDIIRRVLFYAEVILAIAGVAGITLGWFHTLLRMEKTASRRMVAVYFAITVIGISSLSSIVTSKVEDAYSNGYAEGRSSGYESGYEVGCSEGKVIGAIEGQDDVAGKVICEYEKMERKSADEYGLHPEEAVIVLEDYLNGETISADDMRSAIESIRYFYYNGWEVVLGIKEMDVDYYFD